MSTEYQIFYVMDQIEKKNIKIIYCPTEQMTGNFMKKPVQGTKYKTFRAYIMGITN